MDDFLHNLDWVIPMRNGVLTPVFVFFTWLGYAVFFFLALPILFWVWDKNAAHRLAVAILISALVNYFFKDLFQDPRPSAYFMGDHGPDSYGLPSGHTQLGIVFWFSIACEIGKRWAWIGAIIFACGIAFSRLYLGVHDVEDVLAGAVLGIGGLALLRWLFNRPLWVQNSVIGVIGVGVLVFWPHNPIPGTVLMVSGFFAGWMVGDWWNGKRWEISGSTVWLKVLIVVIGLVSLFAVRMILEKIFVGIKTPESYARFVGGFLIGLFVTAGIPYVTAKIGLSKETAHSR
ncbi:phosphatase PAP2 family protein [Verrucomicrobiales bacterium]|nr:phosphatase PAP2 family protein [Verrucomicrobiales bacterium]MDB4662560.1 phosphatase PAP2 family protein [Verrucomicrobiales bacterium]MDC0322415.1 phosphatase PAP2 family protein [Verrucomicrobiales bacterium]